LLFLFEHSVYLDILTNFGARSNMIIFGPLLHTFSDVSNTFGQLWQYKNDFSLKSKFEIMLGLPKSVIRSSILLYKWKIANSWFKSWIKFFPQVDFIVPKVNCFPTNEIPYTDWIEEVKIEMTTSMVCKVIP